MRIRGLLFMLLALWVLNLQAVAQSTPQNDRKAQKKAAKEAKAAAKAERKKPIPLRLGSPAISDEVRRKAQADSLARVLETAPDNSAELKRPEGPVLSLTRSAHDFGQVRQGKPVHHTFRFTNTGSAPLLLKEVTPSCGCTATHWSKEPILPDSTGEITVIFNTAGKVGPQMKHIFVTYNATVDNADTTQNPGEVMLILQGEILGVPGPPRSDD